jgi:hypothetical protein
MELIKFGCAGKAVIFFSFFGGVKPGGNTNTARLNPELGKLV